MQEIKEIILSRVPYRRYTDASEGMAHRISAGELKILLDQSGFAVRKIAVRPNVRYHPTPEATIEFAEASSFDNFLGHLPAELRMIAGEEIMRELAHDLTPEGIRRDGARILAMALTS